MLLAFLGHGRGTERSQWESCKQTPGVLGPSRLEDWALNGSKGGSGAERIIVLEMRRFSCCALNPWRCTAGFTCWFGLHCMTHAGAGPAFLHLALCLLDCFGVGFSNLRPASRFRTCPLHKPLREQKLRTSWCTPSCCGARWTTSPAEVRSCRLGSL